MLDQIQAKGEVLALSNGEIREKALGKVIFGSIKAPYYYHY